MTSDTLLNLIRDSWSELVPLLERVWEAPAKLAGLIQERLMASMFYEENALLSLEVIGSPEQFLCCLTTEKCLVLCGLRKAERALRTHPFAQELIEELGAVCEEYIFEPGGACLLVGMTERLQARLRLPSIALVSLFHPEMYPASRLTLGIAYLASYLRRHHLARVDLLDCQFGFGVREILTYIHQARPAILGVSVNFGQFDLMEQLLDALYGGQAVDEMPVVVLGNVLPAMCFREILKVYPEVVICRKEGELSLAALAKWGSDRSRWHQVPGIYYCGDQGQVITTPPAFLPMEQLPPPALDTVNELFAREGVITAEFSRGCQYNRCSFCPRTHKGSIWRTIPVSSMLEQWEVFDRVFRHFHHAPHVFLADEDFVGREAGERTVQRIQAFLQGTRERNLPITFDASCRADQIFREDRDHQWHVQRGELFQSCVNAGLSRLFLGVESGASAQLLRYNKGSSIEEMISAIRYFSLLRVRLRFGFIFFDPLMSVQDLIDNIDFLGRTDIILPAATSVSVEEIFALVAVNHRQIMPQVIGQAVYENVSYMVSPLEVLAKSQYLFDLRQQASQLISEPIDVSFARYQTKYRLLEIEAICTACQYWVNYCFPIVYALKGLQKSAQGERYAILHQAITRHRELGYFLIRALARVFSLVDNTTIQRWEKLHAEPEGSASVCTMAGNLMSAGYSEEAVNCVLLWYEQQMRSLVEQVHVSIVSFPASMQHIWHTTYWTWSERSLIEMHMLRTA